MKNADMPAMPFTDQTASERFGAIPSGLTKREHFAAMAMQACRTRASAYTDWADLSKDAVDIADALLSELERTSC